MMVFFGLAITIGIVFLVQYFKRADTNGTVSSDRSDNATEILERRYVNGELSREEYREMKAVLKEQIESE
ncbi:MAG: SHOCT domain-containing protein [Spirochaetota bacterium]